MRKHEKREKRENMRKYEKILSRMPYKPAHINAPVVYPPCKDKRQRVLTQRTSIRITRASATSTDHRRDCQDWMTYAPSHHDNTNLVAPE